MCQPATDSSFNPAEINGPLLAWYDQSRRRLPWRDQPDPYAVWVSEIMLQQTRVETVIPYFERWMRLFPDIASLAAASQQDVLKAWEGLGYYSRARSLHQAAGVVCEKYGGSLPAEAGQLGSLPGIGRYTAGAIASIAFGRDEPALDGNIRRVLARLFNVREPVALPRVQALLWDTVCRLLPPGRAGDFNQAMMDLGALICVPRKPACSRCPLAHACQAYRLGVQAQLPVRLARAPIPHYTVTAAVISHRGRLLLARRPQKGLLGGLWEFPGGKCLPDETLEGCLEREILEELGVQVAVGEGLGVYRHAYTHYRVTLHAFRCRLAQDGSQPQPLQAAQLAWTVVENLAEYPMGKIDRQIAARLAAEKAG